jgi:antitoxin ParD1/3/4
MDEVTLSDSSNNPEYLIWAKATRKKINTALEQAKRGEVLEADVVLAQLRAKVQTTKEAT